MSYGNKFILKFKVLDIIPTKTDFVGVLGKKRRKVGKQFKNELIVLNCPKVYLDANNVRIGNTVMMQFFARTTETQKFGKRYYNTSLIIQKIVVVK